MNCLPQLTSVTLPRHYYQVALDFDRLSQRISQARKKTQTSALIGVENPATLLADWETAFQQYVRPLARIFHTLSTTVLAESDSLRLIDTVSALVPLEQQVYSLLTLREMVQNHRFPHGWQRGQHLFLARIDKILNDLQAILTYFNHITDEPQHNDSAKKQYVWDNEIECQSQTTAYHNWCHVKGCLAPHVYLSRQGLGFLHERCRGLWAKLTAKTTPRKGALPLCNSWSLFF